MNINDLSVGDRVLVCFLEDDSHEFSARIDRIEADPIRPWFFTITVVDQDDNGFRVLPDEIVGIIEDDTEGDPFRNDVWADADALARAGFGTDEDYGGGDTPYGEWLDGGSGDE